MTSSIKPVKLLDGEVGADTVVLGEDLGKKDC